MAQSVERGANNAKVISSRLITTDFHFSCGLLSVIFKINFAHINSLKTIIWSTFVVKGSLAQSAERGANNAKVMSLRLILTSFHFLCRLLFF